MYGSIYFPVVGGTLPGSSHMGLPRDGGRRQHKGLDIGAPRGTPVVATVGGIVVMAGNAGGKGGIVVKILDDFGNMHYYAHLDPSSIGVVQPGQRVEGGTLIGYVGSTGNAQGPHLHYSINEASGGRGPLIDPWVFLQGGSYTGSIYQATGLAAVSAPTPTPEPLHLPEGGSFLKVGSKYIVAYRFRGRKDGPSAVIYYELHPDQIPAGATVGHLSPERLAEFERTDNWVKGGSAEVFRGQPAGQKFQDIVDRVLFDLGLADSEALLDKDVMKVVALAMTREMSDAELENRLRATDYWQKRTDKEREWNTLSEAEKQQRIIDEAMKLAQLWFTYVGEDLRLEDRNGDGRITPDEMPADLRRWAEDIASGKASQIQAVNVWMKGAARQNPNSPWSRMLREEQRAQGQHQVDIKNTAEVIRDMYWEWGVSINDTEAMRMAEKVVMNEMAIADVENELREAAAKLYPMKPPEIPTRQWAEPYMDIYMQTLESPEVDLTDPLIQLGLSEGMTFAEFRQKLRNNPRWLQTKGARDEMYGKVSGLAERMGF